MRRSKRLKKKRSGARRQRHCRPLLFSPSSCSPCSFLAARFSLKLCQILLSASLGAFELWKLKEGEKERRRERSIGKKNEIETFGGENSKKNGHGVVDFSHFFLFP